MRGSRPVEGPGEQWSRGAEEQGSRGAEEQRSRVARFPHESDYFFKWEYLVCIEMTWIVSIDKNPYFKWSHHLKFYQTDIRWLSTQRADFDLPLLGFSHWQPWQVGVTIRWRIKQEIQVYVTNNVQGLKWPEEQTVKVLRMFIVYSQDAHSSFLTHKFRTWSSCALRRFPGSSR